MSLSTFTNYDDFVKMDLGADADDDTISLPDEYARENGLSIDSRIYFASLFYQINDSVPQLRSDVEHHGLTNDDFLFQLQLPTFDIHEQLKAPMESIRTLDQAIEDYDLGLCCSCEKPLTQYEARKCLARLTLDPPALSTDSDCDCHELARAVRKLRQPKIGPRMFPKERLDVGSDEGLEFPVSAEKFRITLNRTARCKKLDVPKDAIYHLARAFRDTWCDDEYHRILADAIQRRTCGRDLELTPPLTSYAENEGDFVPSVETCEIPIASGCSAMFEDDLKAAEDAVFRQELQKDASPMVNPIAPQLSPLPHSTPFETVRSKTSSMKLESPLLPIASPPHSTKDLLSPRLLDGINMDRRLPVADLTEAFASNTSNEGQAFDDGLQAEAEKSAASLLQKVEQARISIADAMARVEVPVVDFSIPEPEWQRLPTDTRAQMRWLREAYSLEVPPCPRDTRADSKLRWVPFLQKIDSRALTEETISPRIDQSQLIAITGDPEVPTSASYVWKRPGLAILGESETEVILMDTTSPRPPINASQDLATPTKRKLERTKVERMDTYSSDSDSYVDLVKPSYKRPPRPVPRNHLANEAKLLPNDDSNSTVSILLSNFIDILAPKRRKLSSSSFFKATEKSEAKSQRAATPKDSPRHQRIEKQPQKKTTTVAPCPEIVVPNTPTKLIKGLTLSRRLFSAIEQLYPTAEIIERDFDRWIPTVPTRRLAPKLTTTPPCHAAEADVIISPATGIIVTSLLKVIQKPLPGRSGQSPIRERVSSAARRYERLIVLVSEGNIADETARDLTPSETTAYADFITFLSANVGSRVEVFYAGGGEATLARWLVYLASKHAAEAAGAQSRVIIQDETRWEVFLRRIGFNAYAAQAILGNLKGARSHGPEDGSRLPEGRGEGNGLAAFIGMTSAERLRRFRGLLGGESVLRRVNEVLNASWS